MWHLKTKLGTFWLVEANNDTDDQYLLGINDQELGAYDNVAVAVKDVCEQSTGFLKWDCQDRIKAPDDITQWVEGAPETWNSN